MVGESRVGVTSGLAAATLALLVAGLILSGRGLAVAPVVGSIENEAMSVPLGGSVVDDPSASNGQALKLTAKNEHAQGALTLTAPAVSLVATVRGDFCNGAWPKISLYVDGTNVWTDFVSSSSWSALTIPVSKNAGSHTVRAVIRNGQATTSCVRAIYLDNEIFYGVDPGPPPQVDYIAESLAVSPGAPLAGQSVSFSASVRNASGNDSQSSSDTSLRLDIGDDGTYDLTLTDQFTSALTGGGSEAESWADGWTAVTGTHRFEVCADADSVLDESDDGNNCSTAAFVVTDPPPPDYLAESLATSPADPLTGESVSFLSVVRNQSAGDSDTASESGLRLDVGGDGTYDVTYASQATAALAGGASAGASWADSWVAEIGTHRFEVCADVTAAVAESDEGNNCISALFTVADPPPPQPELDFSATPSIIDNGASSTLTWDATNVDTCTASGAWGGEKALSGSESTGALTETSAYTLTCSGPYGPVVEDVTVTVNPPPGCTIADTSGCVPATVITKQGEPWICSQPLANYGPLPLKVVVTSTAVINAAGAVDLRTGCNGDSDPDSIDLILDVQGDGLTYGAGEDAVKIRLQAGWVNGIQITGRADCGPRPNTSVHQDGIQAQGGRNITFVDFSVGDYDSGISTCQGAGGAMFYSSASGYVAEDVHVIRGTYIACNKGLNTGLSSNTGSVTGALFRSGRVDGSDPKCVGIHGPATCAGTGTVAISNVTCQRWNTLQQAFVTLIWP